MTTKHTLRAAGASLLVLLTACGGDRAGAEAAVRIDTLADGSVHVMNPETRGEVWQLRELWRLGALESEGPDQFGRITALEADGAGRVYVLDGHANDIRVFDADGRHLRSFGRAGGGPGELRQPSGLSLSPDGNLWVANPGNVRYEVFDTAGAFVTSHRQLTQMMSFPWRGLVDRSGRVYDSGFGVVLRADGDGEPDTLRLPEYDAPQFVHSTGTGSMSYSIPYSAQLHWALDPDGRLWTGVSDAYRIALRDDGGKVVRTVEKPYTAVPVTASEREGVRERLRGFTDQGGTVDLSRVPREKSAFTRLAFDDRGHLWVRPSLPEEAEAVVFDVFDPQGIYLGHVSMQVESTALRVALVRGSRLYAAVDSEEGVPQLIAYELVGR